jgi:hypothetical protein
LAAIEGCTVVGFEGGEGRIDHFPARHDDDILAGVNLVATEQFARQTLGPIANNRATHLSRGCYTQPGSPATVRYHEHCHEPA